MPPSGHLQQLKAHHEVHVERKGGELRNPSRVLQAEGRLSSELGKRRLRFDPPRICQYVQVCTGLLPACSGSEAERAPLPLTTRREVPIESKPSCNSALSSFAWRWLLPSGTILLGVSWPRHWPQAPEPALHVKAWFGMSFEMLASCMVCSASCVRPAGARTAC